MAVHRSCGELRNPLCSYLAPYHIFRQVVNKVLRFYVNNHSIRKT